MSLGQQPSAAPQAPKQTNANASRALAAGQTDKALPELEAAAKRFPHDSRIQYNLGLALSRKGRIREAVAPLKKAAADPQTASDARLLLGLDYFEDKNYSEALAELRQLDASVQRDRVLYLIEESSRRTNHPDDAKAAFHELLTTYPNSAWTHFLLGNAYEDQQDLDKATAEYKLALETDPSIPNGSFAIGYLYWRQQDTENARQWLTREAVRGCHGLANYYLGEISRQEKDGKQAEAFYRKSLACDASNSNAHMRLGMVLEEQKRYPEAAAQLKDAIRLAPDVAAAHYHLGSVYRSMGRQQQARLEFEKVRQIQAAKDTGVDVTRGGK